MSSSPLVGIGPRRRVERLLDGDVRKEDLHELFFNMRDQAGGSGLVSEIGNFIAHPNIRTQGIVRTRLSDQFAFLKFRIPFSYQNVITTDLPASFPNAMRANLRRMRKHILLQETGKSPAQSEKILARVLGRMSPTVGGGLSKVTLTSKEEFDVCACVFRHIRGGSIFTDSDLIEDLCRALQKQRLLEQREKSQLKKIKPYVSLFALTAMHNRKIQLLDGSVVEQYVIADIRDNLAIFAAGDLGKDVGAGVQRVAAWVFETDLPISQFCEIGVAPLGRYPFHGELTMDGR